RQLGTRFSCAPADVPAAIDKLSRDAEATTAEVTQLRGRLAGMIAASFAGEGSVIAALPGDADLLRGVAAKLAAAGRDALLAAPDETGTTVVLFRAQGSSVDCGALFKKLAAAAGGRGGGRPDRAEGRLATRIDNWPEALATHLPV
ncbi:MAG TPA: DHHA1 domain-containing protein, partial [Kofleriaceae bacterium]|nr:DHHA1 domain-containing protein [Kofleriaceae bacterium]